MKKLSWISILLSCTLWACQPSANHAEQHDHEGEETEHSHHEHEQISITLFNENTELFAEFPQLMLGHEAKFTSHFTNLASYRPYLSGDVKVKLIGNGKTQTSEKSTSQNGIFTPSLTPQKAGWFSLIFEVNSEYGHEEFVANNIRVFKNHEEAEELEEEEQHNDGIKFLKEEAWKVEFGTTVVKKSAFRNIIKTTGELQPSVDMEKQVVAQSSGILHFQDDNIVAGKTVQKGNILFRISSGELAGNNLATQFVQAKSELEKSKAEYERAKTLRQDQIVSEKAFFEAKAAFENAEAHFNSINKNYNSNGLEIKSPVNGFICDIYASEGQYVEKGSVLAKVDQGSKLMLQADIYQKHLGQLQHIHSANFKLPYQDKIFRTDDLHGKIIAYGKDIHEEDYTTPLYFEIDLTPELYAGSFVEVYLKSESSRDVLHVKKSSILEDQGLKYVFVQKSGESYEKRFVTTGMSNGEDIEILSGLQENERVVSKGAYFVKLASLSGSLPAHNHNH